MVMEGTSLSLLARVRERDDHPPESRVCHWQFLNQVALLLVTFENGAIRIWSLADGKLLA